MDFGYLLRILVRRKWLILSVMTVAAAATFLFIEMRPERYKASVIISTGIVNYKGINSDNSDAFVQQYQVENAFSNLIEFAQSRSTIKLLTIELLRRDLLAEGATDAKPFRQAHVKKAKFTDDDRKKLLADLVRIDLDSISDPAFSQDFDYRLDKVARAYGYDHDAIRKNLSVKRKAQTDYLTVEITTEDPVLSMYMANEYVRRFMTYYENLAVREKRKNVSFYTQLAARMRHTVDSIKSVRYAYLYQRGLPALGKQSEELVKQLNELEMARQEALSRREAATESYGRIQKYIDDKSSRDAGETRARVLDKSNTADLADRVRVLREQSIKAGGKDEEIEGQLASAQQELQASLRSSARTLGKPKQQDESRRTREELYKERVSIDLDRISAEKTASQLGSKIGALQSKLHTYVTNDEYATTLEAEQERAEEEFGKVNEQLIKAKLDLENAESPLSIVENAQLPEWPEPNRQVLLSAFAGMATGSMTAIALFLLAYFDNTLQTPELFRRFTGGLPLLGAISTVPLKGLDFEEMFGGTAGAGGRMGQVGKPDGTTAFRESLRKLRGAVLKAPHRVYLFTSTRADEGKTFTMHALAYSLAANQKRVIMLDTNFKEPLPESFTDQPTPNSGLLNKLLRDHGLVDVFQVKNRDDGAGEREQRVDIIGNHGQQLSPSEAFSPETFQAFVNGLLEHYDYVFLEAGALNQYSDTQELEPYADQVVAVFNAASSVRSADKDSVEYLRLLGDKFAGAVLTGIDERNL